MKNGNKQPTLDAEYSVIGSLLLEPNILGELMTLVKPEDFLSKELRNVFQAAIRLFAKGRSVDAVTIRSEVGSEYNQLLMGCMDIVPGAANWKNYVFAMIEQSRVYTARMLGAELSEIHTTDNARKILSKLGTGLSENTHTQIMSMQDSLINFFEEQATARKFIHWGFDKLDRQLYSDYGDFVVIAARPSIGKTALALQMAHYMGRSDKVGFYSFETSPGKLTDRLVSSACIVDFNHIKRRCLTPEEMDRVVRWKKDICTSNLELIPAAGMSVQDILTVALTKGHKVIFVDYLQLVRSEGNTRFEQITSISVALHTMAQAHGILVVALSQLSRPQKGAIEQPPTLLDLRESGQIEQDADAVFALHLKDATSPSGDRYLRVLKNKEGQLGQFALAFEGRFQMFAEHMEKEIERRKEDWSNAQVSMR